jgi:filamentous hemagglutinin family protein
MNKSYRLIWNEFTNAWVAVSEIIKAKGKSGKCASGAVLLAAAGFIAVSPAPTFAAPPALGTMAPAATALPTGGQLVAGQASIAQTGATMNVTQTTNRAAVDWATFNVGSQARVNFIQPSSSAAILNRVLDSNPSQIFGRISANGQVFLTNASGIYFSPGSSVNVGALTATTHSISNDDFMAGRFNFTRNGATGKVENEGNLTADLGGYIALLAPEVRNNGVIIAQMGTVALAAGEAYELQFDGARLANIRVEPATIAALVESGNAVQAPGGLVILSARAADQLQGSVVRNSGAIEARGLVEKGGKIVLEGDHITLASGSTLDASGATGGGEVLVGGGWQGGGGLYQTTTTMEAGATIDVSATKVGAGGTAVLWSDVNNPASQTRAYGTIWAKGGEDGGDGGRIETSGHWLSVTGLKTSTAAPKGRFGEWLLDPYDITIGAAATGDAFTDTNPGDDTYSATTQISTILASDIGTALGNGNVTIQTSTADSSITVASSITKSTGADSTLTLKAHGSVTLNSGATISSTLGKLNTVLWADSDGNSDGFVWLKGSNTITTNAGHLWVGGGATNTSWNGLTVGGDGTSSGYALGNGTTNSNGIEINGTTTITTAGGNIAMYGKSRDGAPLTVNADGIWFNGNSISVNSGTGTILFDGVSQATGGNVGIGVEFFMDTHTITSAAPTGDAITIRGTGPAAAMTWGVGVFLHANEGLYATGGGNISITGIGRGEAQREGIRFHEATSVASAGSGNLSLITDTIFASGSFSGTGSLTVKPYTVSTTIGLGTGTGTLSLPSAFFTSYFANGFSGITVGRSDGTGNIDVNGLTFRDNLTLLAGGANANITLAGAIANSGTDTSSGSLTVKAGGNIYLTSSAAIATQNQPVIFISDADGSGVGNIQIGKDSTATSIVTNGGHVWMGGGSGTATWNSLTVGNGSAKGATNNFADDGFGLWAYNTTINAGGGDIALYGQASSGGPAGINIGLQTGGGTGSLVSTIKTSGTGSISMTGVAGSNAGGDNFYKGGIEVFRGLIQTGSGAIILTGTGGATSSDNSGISFAGMSWQPSTTSKIVSSSGAITLTGTKGTGGTGSGIRFGSATGYYGFDGTAVTSSSSDITLIADTINWTGMNIPGSNTLQSSGALAIRPLTANTTIGIAGGAGTLALTAANFSTNFVNGFSGITIGDATSGAITVGGATTLNDFTTFITGGNLAINAALNATGQTVTLTGDSGATVSGSGVITATSLLLNGSGATYTLNSGAGHSVGTLAASTGSGNVSFYNSAALAVGTVGGTNGITTSGTVDVEALTGDLTISQNIATTSTSASAVVLNAGRSTAALTTTGGNILISGSPTVTVGAGGTAKFYSASVAGSTGLTALIGSGTGRFRYASDETATNYSTALASGKYAIYREAPAITVQASNYTSTYGASVAPTAFSVTSGSLQNGDTLGNW